MHVTVLIAAYGGALLLANELFRRSKWANLFWFLGPLALLPVWLLASFNAGWFYWAKTAALIGSSTSMAAWRFLSPTSSVLRNARKAFLVLNILEAVAADALAVNGPSFGAFHAVNVASGVILILALPDIATSRVRGEYAESSWDVGWPWILGYTFWNWTFVSFNLPALAGLHVAVLAVPLLLAMTVDRTTWGQARIITLSCTVFGTMALPGPFAAFETTIASPVPAYVAAVLGLGFGAWSLTAKLLKRG